MQSGELRHLAASDNKHRGIAEIRKDLLRKAHRNVAYRNTVLRYLRMRVHLLGDVKGALKEVMKMRSNAPGLNRLAVSLLYLPQDLRLTEHHRIEARRYAVEVTNRTLIVQLIKLLMRSSVRSNNGLKEAANPPTRSTHREDLKTVAG